MNEFTPPSYARKFSLLLLGLSLGCSNPQVPSATTSPLATVTVTATPSASAPVLTETYRLRAEFLDAPDVTFEVTLNGKKLGTFNTDSRNDISPNIVQGTNEVGLTWKNGGKLVDSSRAQIYIESQRAGQDDWNTLFSREVSMASKETSATGSFSVGVGGESQPADPANTSASPVP